MLKQKYKVALLLLSLCFPSLSFGFELDFKSNASEELMKKLQTASKTMRARNDDLNTPTEIIGAAQADYSALLTRLYKDGYYGPAISIKVDGIEASTLSLISLPQNIETVTIDIQTGPQFVFGRTDISPEAPLAQEILSLKSGEVAEANIINKSKNEVLRAWREAGHAKAQLTNQDIIADHKTQKLDVQLKFTPGPRTTIGELKFSGDTKVHQNRLSKIANLRKRHYSTTQLDAITKRLLATGTFKSVVISEAEHLNPDNSLDLHIKVSDKKPRRFGFGAEISSVRGASLSAFWLHRNIFGDADRLRIYSNIENISGETRTDYNFGFTYRRPATVSSKTTLLLEAEQSVLRERNFDSDNIDLFMGVDVETAFTSNFQGGIGFRQSKVQDDFGNRIFRLITFPLSAEKDKRNDSLDPTSGSYIAAEVTPFLGLYSSENGIRIYGDARYYKSVDNKQLTFAARAQIGSIINRENSEVPPDMLFFSGGAGTVRGQPFNSLNVTTAAGTTGGTSFLGFSGEIRRSLNEKFTGVLFGDMGYIGADSYTNSSAQAHSGAGLGIRYNTGFGPIRFDLGWPVSGDTGDGAQLYLGIGQAF